MHLLLCLPPFTTIPARFVLLPLERSGPPPPSVRESAAQNARFVVGPAAVAELPGGLAGPQRFVAEALPWYMYRYRLTKSSCFFF